MIDHIIQTMLGVVLRMLETETWLGRRNSIAVWTRRVVAVRRTLPSLLSPIETDTEGLARNFAGSGMRLATLLLTSDHTGKSPYIAMVDGQDTSHARLVAAKMACARGIYWYISPVYGRDIRSRHVAVLQPSLAASK